MQVRSRRQPSFSSQRDMGSEAKRAKSKLSSHGLKRESEEDLRPRVLFRANKEEVQTGKTRKNNKNEARKTSMDKVLERIAEKSTKNTCKGSQLMLSLSHIAQNSGKKETLARSYIRQNVQLKLKVTHMRKHSLMAPDKLKSPYKFDYNRSGMHASHEVGDVYNNVGPLRKRASCQSAVEVHSARTANNKRTTSGTREKADINLKQREFDLDKFRRLFGFKKTAEKRLHTEFALSNGDLTVANKKLNYSSQVQVPQAKPHPYLNLKKCQLQTNKISSVEKKSHRDKPTASSGLVQKIINGMKFDKLSKSRSRSKEGELISQRSTSKSKSRPVRKHKKSQNNITPTKKMSTSKPLHQSGDIKLDEVEDIGFLFSKKLTNIEKMGMLNQRNQIVKENKEHKIRDYSDKINVKKPTVSLVKASRLATNYSGSDSLETMPMPMCDQKDNNDTSKDSEMENQEIENQLAQAQRSFCLRSSQLSSRTKAKVLNNHIESHENSATKSKQKFSKNLFSRRRSFCEENQREKAQKELECALGPENISMTSEFGGIDQQSSFDPSGSYCGRSGLQKSNSELLLRSIVSSSTNQLTTKDAYRLQEKVEEERQSLINYIKNNQQLNKGVPRTTLQFYKIVKLLGRGSFGKVHLGIHLLTRRKVAIKCIDKQYIMEEKAQGKVVQEINILKGLSHKNLIKVLEVFENKKYVFIVTDYAARGDLLQYMKEHGIFKEHKAKPIAAQILNGLEYIHGKGILHRDVKLDNILLTKDLKVKICDFGVSRHMPKGTHNIKERCGTPAYIAPEIIKNTGYYGFHADVWSFGVLIYAMVTGTIPFKAKSIPELHKLIIESDFEFPESTKLSSSFKDLMRKILVKDPTKRISIDKLWSHPWLQDCASMRQENSIDDRETVNNVVLDSVVSKLESYGYSQDMINETLSSNLINHLAATYLLLLQKYIG